MAGEHGGRRVGAGRPAGTAWKPVVAAMRVAAVEHVQDVIGGDTDPLVIALAIAADTKQPVEIRLGACALCIPVCYPRLSATQVSATHVTAKIDPGELLDRISARIARVVPRTIDGDASEAPDQVAAA